MRGIARVNVNAVAHVFLFQPHFRTIADASIYNMNVNDKKRWTFRRRKQEQQQGGKA